MFARWRRESIEGLQRAYDVARAMESGPERLTRVIILSCGSTQTDSFVDIVKAGAADDIGLTFLGVLLPFDHRLAERLSVERGGNYFYVDNDLGRVKTLFEEEFDFIVTPLAYDLSFKLGIDPAQYRIGQLYGIPGADGADAPGFEVSTAFVSKRKGAMVGRLEPVAAEPSEVVATINFSYNPESAHGWTEPVDTEVAATRGSATTSFDSDGVRKSVALVNMAERMKDAIEQSDVSILAELRTYLHAEATALDDDALQAEVQLIDKLIEVFGAD